MKRIYYTIFFTFLSALIAVTPIRAQGYGSPTATVTDVYTYDLAGAGNRLAIVYTVSGCTGRNDFYVPEIDMINLDQGVILIPNDEAISGSGMSNPVGCGTHTAVWNFDREPQAKQGLLRGNVRVDVHTIDGSYRKYAKKFTRLERKRLKALAKGHHRRVARIERRQLRKQVKYGVKS
jgi:hypothetical protein